jgi:glycosyltransferase involved in cell wall biosynthesis
VAVSQHLAHHVTKFGVSNDRVRVVYNGVDASRFFPGSKHEARKKLGVTEDNPVLLWVGSLVPVKGLDVLMLALQRVSQLGQGFRCYLVGDGPCRRLLVNQIGQLGLTDRVSLVGPRPHRDLPDWFRAADVFVLPSRSEGVPNVLLEAMACGVPFVATDVGGVAEVADSASGPLVEPNPEALANALTRVLAASKTIRLGAPRMARSHADSAAQLADVLEEAVRERHPIAA